MIYLVEDRDYVKIGFTKNVEARMKNYETDNCYSKLIDSKPGTRKDESTLHELCKKWHYKNEWFYNVPEIRDIWNNYQHSFNELEHMKETTEKIINLIYQNKKIPDLKILSQWKSIQENQHWTQDEWVIKESKDESLYKIWKDYCALNKLQYLLLNDTKENFDYDFGLFKAEITWRREDYKRWNVETTFIFQSTPED